MPVLTIQATENMIGANHPTLTDTLNRLTLAEHNDDGTHKSPLAVSVTGSSASCTGNAATSSACSGNAATATTAANVTKVVIDALDIDAATCRGNAASATFTSTATTATNASGTGSIPKMLTNGLQIVRGSVKDDGSLLIGTGFTPTKPGNDYLVTFSVGLFSATPVVVACVNGTGNDILRVHTVTTNSFYVRSQNAAGQYQSSTFDFIAIGTI